MSINRVNTGESFKFLANQSSILHTVDTNKITINGINVIVGKPKRGDIMCITKDQKVIWIDGLSINPKQLSKEFEPVGICLVVKGNKALVRYKEERSFRWAASERWEIPESSIMSDGFEHSLKITLNGVENPTPFEFTSRSKSVFVNKLNEWFLDHDKSYSAELVELDTDHSAYSKDENGFTILNPKNRIIVNACFTESYNDKTISIEEIGSGTRAIAKHIKGVLWPYLNNGFQDYGGCCRASYYDYYSKKGLSPAEPMNSVKSYYLIRLDAFNSNENCKILRDNYANYDEYVDANMIKFPCGKGGAVAEFTCGKENTYKLADCTFLDNTSKDGPKQEFLYPAANWAASISLNAPKLGKGNWWLPSAAEITEIMRDITYGTSFQETKPDIINTVLDKLASLPNSGWSRLYANQSRFTSVISSNRLSVYTCLGIGGGLSAQFAGNDAKVSPITVYEF